MIGIRAVDYSVRLRLEAVQLRVETVPPHQCAVAALLHDLAILQDHDQVGHRHSDPGEAGEYAALARAVGGQVVRLSAGSRDHINPLDLPPASEGETHDALGEHVAEVLRLLEVLLAGEGEQLGPAEKGHLEAALFGCYRDAGITRDCATHDRPAPTLPDLHATLDNGADPFGLAEIAPVRDDRA